MLEGIWKKKKDDNNNKRDSNLLCKTYNKLSVGLEWEALLSAVNIGGAAHNDKWWEKNPGHLANLNNGNNFPLHLTSRLRSRLPQRPTCTFLRCLLPNNRAPELSKDHWNSREPLVMRVSLGEWQEGIKAVVWGVDFDREIRGSPHRACFPQFLCELVNLWALPMAERGKCWCKFPNRA